MPDIVSIITLILILGVIIFVHELGHLIFAKKYGVYCHEFALGMGPKVYSRKYGETTYSLRLIPIGGFVSMAGEEDEGEEVPEGRRLFDISKLQQAMIMFAGAFFNFILGFVVILLITIINGAPVNDPIVGAVVPDSPADNAGVVVGSEIESVNGKVVNDYSEAIIEFDKAKASGSITVVFDVDGNDVIVADNDVDETYVLGIQGSTTRRIIPIITSSFGLFISMFTLLFKSIILLITQFGTYGSQVSGPVGIYGVVDSARTIGFTSILSILALISINIGFFNLLPIPGLDGSKILIAIGEYIFKKDLPRKLYIGLSVGGLILLLSLMLLVTINDIMKLV